MQNSGLGVVLASAHFGPLAALPSALAAVWHNGSGSILATVRSKKSATVINTTKDETVAVVPLSSSTKG